MNKPCSLFVAGAAMSVLSACGPDPVIGTWNYTGSNVATVTSPTTSTQMIDASGTLTVSTSTSSNGGYVYRFADANSSDVCTLNGTLSGDVITFIPSQSCSFTVTGGMLVATLTSGTSTATTGSARTQTIHIAYTFVGTVNSIGFSGTGVEDFSATPVAM